MKALEKDRARRYETANGFARDIQRYLADEVVRGPAAEPRLPAEEVRQAEQGAGDRGEPGLADAGGRDRRAPRLGMRVAARRAETAEAERRQGTRTTSATDGDRVAKRKARDEAARPRRSTIPTKDLLPRPSRRTTRWRTRSRSWKSSTARPRRWERGSRTSRNSSEPSAGRSRRPTTAWRLGKGRSADAGPARRGAKARSAVSRSLSGSRRPRAHSSPPRSTGRRGPGDGRGGRQGPRTHARPRPPRHPWPRSTTSPRLPDAGRLPEAIALRKRRPRRPDRQARPRPPRHPDHACTTSPSAYQAAGRLAEAIAAARSDVRDARIAKLGPDHPDTLATLAQPRRGVRRPPASSAEAIALLRATLRDARSPSSAPTTPTP